MIEYYSNLVNIKINLIIDVGFNYNIFYCVICM